MTEAPTSVLGEVGLWIVDLDGVVWLSGTPIGDVGAALDSLRAHDARIVFVTNNSSPTIERLRHRLAGIGVTVEPEELATSAQVVAALLHPGQRAAVLADDGVHEALSNRGVDVVDSGGVDAAVVGWNRTFDFAQLTRMADAARSSGRLLATNGDPTHPTPDGLLPGTGALVAAVSTASGILPEIAGKPHPPMTEWLRPLLERAEGRSSALIGDQPGTDGLLAERLGIPFVLVDSGVTAPGAAVDGCSVAYRCDDLVTLADNYRNGLT